MKRVRMPSGWLSLPSPHDLAARAQAVPTRALLKAMHADGQLRDVPLRLVLAHRAYVESGAVRIGFWHRPTFKQLLADSAMRVLQMYVCYMRAVGGLR